MAQALKNIGVLALLGLAAGQVWAAPAFFGVWKGGLGSVRLSTEGGRVVGTVESSRNLCRFPVGKRVLDAELQGDVLVGKVSLCQKGPSCEERVFDVLAFHDPGDGSLAALVKLDPGCSSPALKDDRVLVLTPPEDADARGSSAVAVASKRNKLTQENARLAEREFTEARRQFEAKNFRGALRHYDLGLTFHPQNWAAHNIVGIIHMQLGNVPAALRAYRYAESIRPNESVIHYNMACAYARARDRDRALQALREAIRLGFGRHPDDARALGNDENLSQLLGTDPEFRKLVERVEKAPRRQGR